MQRYRDLSGKMRHLPIKQAVRKSPVNHCRRHSCFKDGLNLAAWSDKEKAYPPGDASMAVLFFTAAMCYLNGAEEDRDEYNQLHVATSDHTISTESPP